MVITTALIARDTDVIVGSAALEHYGTTALLRSVAVAAVWRGQGLGQRLTAAALDLARECGDTQVYLLTKTATDFFPRFGFQPITRAEVDPAIQQSVEFTSACPIAHWRWLWISTKRLRLPDGGVVPARSI